MSEFRAALEKVNYGKYIDEIQTELRRAIADVGPGKGPQQVEAIEGRLQELMRRQVKELARETGILGTQIMVFMTAMSILSTAWISFILKRDASDLSRSPEERLATIETLDALAGSLAKVIEEASNYAERAAAAQLQGAEGMETSETKGSG